MALPTIPYRPQVTNWTCGAASLRMIYASYGLEVGESDIWALLKSNRFDPSGVLSSRLVWEVCRRGLSAVVLQARSPWDMLQVCMRLGIRVVFNLPAKRGSPQRHFGVLAGGDELGIVLHD